MISIGLTRCSTSKAFFRSFSSKENPPDERKHLLCLTTFQIIQEMCHFAISHAWIKLSFPPPCRFSTFPCAQEFNMLPGIKTSTHISSSSWWRELFDMKQFFPSSSVIAQTCVISNFHQIKRFSPFNLLSLRFPFKVAKIVFSFFLSFFGVEKFLREALPLL